MQTLFEKNYENISVWIIRLVRFIITLLLFFSFIIFGVHFYHLNVYSINHLRSPQQRQTPSFTFNNLHHALPLEGKIIFLDPGHGGYDPGCVYPLRDPKYFEKDFNLTIALETASLLESLGAKVILTREEDYFLSIYARAAMLHLYFLDYADRKGTNTLPDEIDDYLRHGMLDTIRVNSTSIADGCMGPMVGSGFSDELIMLLELQYEEKDFLFLSIHINWNSDESMRGVQVYYVTDESIIISEDRLLRENPYYTHPDFVVRDHYYGRDGDLNATLAQIMYDAIIETTPEMETNARQIVPDNFAVLREHGIPAVMLELGFLSNQEDREYLSNPDIISQLSEGIALGCIQFFEYINFESSIES